MARLLTLGDLHKHFEEARDKLARDRQLILSHCPFADEFNRNEYSFAYLQAERLGMEVIAESLQEVSWLPMQLDPRSEILLKDRTSMKRWASAQVGGQPDDTVFGNDFIHALTRTAMTSGWTSGEFSALSSRIGILFHDLSCLIGLIYYGVWMSENGIEGLPITNPEDLERTAQEIALLIKSPEVLTLLKAKKKTSDTQAPLSAPRKHNRPTLHVIENAAWTGDGSSA